jgi:hypothetical protein
VLFRSALDRAGLALDLPRTAYVFPTGAVTIASHHHGPKLPGRRNLIAFRATINPATQHDNERTDAT